VDDPFKTQDCSGTVSMVLPDNFVCAHQEFN